MSVILNSEYNTLIRHINTIVGVRNNSLGLQVASMSSNNLLDLRVSEFTHITHPFEFSTKFINILFDPTPDSLPQKKSIVLAQFFNFRIKEREFVATCSLNGKQKWSDRYLEFWALPYYVIVVDGCHHIEESQVINFLLKSLVLFE